MLEPRQSAPKTIRDLDPYDLAILGNVPASFSPGCFDGPPKTGIEWQQTLYPYSMVHNGLC